MTNKDASTAGRSHRPAVDATADGRRTVRDDARAGQPLTAGAEWVRRPDGGGDAGLKAELYVRADPPTPARVRSVVDRMDGLVADGRLDGYVVHAVPPEVNLSERSMATAATNIRGLLDVADRLAGEDRHRYPFRIVDRYSAITDETTEVFLLPALCLLLYDGPDLVDLAPYHGRDGTWHIEDCLSLVDHVAPNRKEAAEGTAERDSPTPSDDRFAPIGPLGKEGE